MLAASHLVTMPPWTSPLWGGRRSRQGVEVLAWTADSERATRQEVFGSAVSVPPLSPGQRVTVYFPVDGSSARGGRADVEFEMRRVGKSGAQRQTVRDVPIVPEADPSPRRTGTGQARKGSASAAVSRTGRGMVALCRGGLPFEPVRVGEGADVASDREPVRPGALGMRLR
jgi:hypothetical protein